MDWFIATTYIVPYMFLLLMDKPVFMYSRKKTYAGCKSADFSLVNSAIQAKRKA
jgi:hypothetical protein